jgi:hypothetical protein
MFPTERFVLESHGLLMISGESGEFEAELANGQL